MALSPNASYTICGVKINEKIIPDGTVWKDAAKAKNAGFAKGGLYKHQQKICGNGIPLYVTIHNTDDLSGVEDDAEQYTRATYNENMGGTRVQFYIDDLGGWQNLKAGLGLCANDPKGSAEVGYHSGDGVASTSGNITSLSIECVMNDTKAHDEKAKDNTARVAAYLLWFYGLPIDRLVSHTFWVNKLAGKTFTDVDKQCTNPIAGKKWCPTYIFASNNATVAYNNWKNFKSLVSKYVEELQKANNSVSKSESTSSTNSGLYRVQIGAFSTPANAQNYLKTAKSQGFEGFVVAANVNGKMMYRVQIGAFSSKTNAENYLKEAKANGFDGFIVGENFDNIKVGSVVMVKAGAKTYTGGNLASFVYKTKYTVSEIKGDRVVIKSGSSVVAAVKMADLTLV